MYQKLLCFSVKRIWSLQICYNCICAWLLSVKTGSSSPTHLDLPKRIQLLILNAYRHNCIHTSFRRTQSKLSSLTRVHFALSFTTRNHLALLLHVLLCIRAIYEPFSLLRETFIPYPVLIQNPPAGVTPRLFSHNHHSRIEKNKGSSLVCQITSAASIAECVIHIKLHMKHLLQKPPSSYGPIR